MKRRLIKAPGGISHSSLSETDPSTPKLSCLQSPSAEESLCFDSGMVHVSSRSPPSPRYPTSLRGLHPTQGPNWAGVPGNCHPQEAGPPQRSEAGGGEMRGTWRREGGRGIVQPWVCDYQSATPLVPRESHVTSSSLSQGWVVVTSPGSFTLSLRVILAPCLDYLLLPFYRWRNWGSEEYWDLPFTCLSFWS